MFRKTIALVIGLSMFLSMSLVAFSLDEQPNIVTNAELESSFEIIEPKVKLKKELYIRDNLLVSISLSEEFENFQIPIEMNLYAVEEFVELANGVENGRLLDESVLREQVSLDNVEFRKTIEVNVTGLNSGKISEVYNDLSGYKTYLSDVLKLTRNNIVKLNTIDISIVETEADKITEETETDIEETTEVKETEEVTETTDVSIELEVETIVSYEEKLKELQRVSAQEKEKSATLVLLYEKVLAELDLVEAELDKVERIYNLLFERRINESILVEKSGLLPYFKYTYEELNAGQYRLEFIRNDNEVIVKTVDFSINKKSQLTEEKIKENITESLNILYNNN